MKTKFAVEDLTIHRIIEIEEPATGPGYSPKEFFPDLTPEMLEENRGWMTGNGLDKEHGNILLCFQSYILRTPHHNILVDSCIGNDKNFPTRPNWHKRADGGNYMRQLAEAGLKVEDIDFVMCSHLHPDHVGWNTRLENGRWVPTFPKARYLFSQRELDYWTAEHKKTPITYMDDSVLPIIAANRADLVKSDHALDDHVHLVPTPGHSPDHFAVHAGKRAAGAVFTGDCIHSPLQARYPELGMRADWDRKMGAQSRRKFLEHYCDSETLFCAMHFPSPSVGHLKRWGEGFRLSYVE